jgi:hypothetical protein
VPERVWEEDELLPFLPFSLDLWRNICTVLKKKMSAFNNIFQDIYIYIYIYIYIVITINCACQKSSASESSSVTRALSHSHLSCFSVSHFDFRPRFFEGPGSSSINCTSCVPNSVSPAPSDTVKLRLWCPSFSS